MTITFEDVKPKIFVRALWGFDPLWASALGFTRERHREWFLEQYCAGDLVAIYGASGSHTSPVDVGRALGFVMLDPRPIQYQDRASPDAKEWLEKNHVQHRWNYGVPIKRAFRCTHRVQFRHLITESAWQTSGRLRGSRGALVSAQDARELLKLRVIPESVYGEAAVDFGKRDMPLIDFFSPSKAPTVAPCFTVSDGPRRLCLSKFSGPSSLVLGDCPPNLKIAKVGLSKVPSARIDQLNQAFPPAARLSGFSWKLMLESQMLFPDYAAAKAAEDKLKKRFDAQFRCLGGEFFLGPWDRMEAAFASESANPNMTINRTPAPGG